MEEGPLQREPIRRKDFDLASKNEICEGIFAPATGAGFDYGVGRRKATLEQMSGRDPLDLSQGKKTRGFQNPDDERSEIDTKKKKELQKGEPPPKEEGKDTLCRRDDLDRKMLVWMAFRNYPPRQARRHTVKQGKKDQRPGNDQQYLSKNGESPSYLYSLRGGVLKQHVKGENECISEKKHWGSTIVKRGKRAGLEINNRSKK